MTIVAAVVRIIRPYSSLVAFLAILIPVFARTKDLHLSLQRATPLLFISMCTFIINDLDDIEKDKINHPDRPLPSGQLHPPVVAVLYFVCLGSALLSIRFGVGGEHIAFLYYLLLTICISYSCVTEYLPTIKPLYVAVASLVPVAIIVAYFPHETALYSIGCAFFFFNLGRELCKDLLDRSGDPVSFLHRLAPRRVAVIAFAAQAAGLLLLSLHIEDLVGFLDIVLMTLLFMLAFFYGFKLGRLNVATALTKAMMFLGLYFLV